MTTPWDHPAPDTAEQATVHHEEADHTAPHTTEASEAPHTAEVAEVNEATSNDLKEALTATPEKEAGSDLHANHHTGQEPVPSAAQTDTPSTTAGIDQEPAPTDTDHADIQTLSAVIKLPSNAKALDFLPRDTQHVTAYFSALQTEAKANGNESLFSRLWDKIAALKDAIGFGNKAKVTELLGVLIQWYADISSGKSNLSTVQENFIKVLWNANPHKIYKAMSKFVADTQTLKTFLQIS